MASLMGGGLQLLRVYCYYILGNFACRWVSGCASIKASLKHIPKGIQKFTKARIENASRVRRYIESIGAQSIYFQELCE